jgi:hypothetical protein
MDFNKISSILDRYQVLLFNSMEVEAIKTSVAKYGYDETKLQEGIKLHNETLNLLSIREKSMTDQVNATLAFNSELLRAKELFKNVVTIARRVFLPFPAGMDLLPETTNISDFDLWKATVDKLYNGIILMPQLLSKLTKYGYTEEMFRNELIANVSMEKLKNIQKIKNADLQQKTIQRDEKLKELQEFCNTYQEIALNALMSQPLLLEKIGLKILKKYLTALKPPKVKKEKRQKKE